MDRQYYGDHALTLARHPSETDERLMIRVLAFALHADDALTFGRGVGAEDEPALWQKDLTGTIDLWIEVGQPDEKVIRQACSRSRQVVVYAYGIRDAELWWTKSKHLLDRLGNLTVINVPSESIRALTQLTQLNMQLQWTIQEGQIWIADETHSLHIELKILKTSTVPSRP